MASVEDLGPAVPQIAPILTQSEAVVPRITSRPGCVIRSRTDSGLCKLDQRRYIGLLKDIPPPQTVKEKWDSQMRDYLLDSICDVTKRLKLSDNDLTIEVELYMTAKAETHNSFDSSSITIALPSTVVLEPTVWVFCSSRRCKRKVKEIIEDLPRLKQFMIQHQIKGPATCSGSPEINRETETTGQKTSLFVEAPLEGAVPGLKARFLITTENRIIERRSTIGGLIMIEDTLYAITTAHTLFELAEGDDKAEEGSSFGSDDDSVSKSGSDSESDPEDKSPSELPAKRGPRAHQHTSPTADPGPGWIRVGLPRVLAYAGRGTTKGDCRNSIPAPPLSDFCLIPAFQLGLAINQIRSSSGHQYRISDIVANEFLDEGPVSICNSVTCSPPTGYLLTGASSIIVKGTIMKTRKIQIGLPGSSYIPTGLFEDAPDLTSAALLTHRA
jgi:hypothetical protein